MGIGKQAKILTNKQQELLLTYLEKSRYPLRNKVMLLFSFKAGLRAKEIAAVTWSMVCNADGKIGIITCRTSGPNIAPLVPPAHPSAIPFYLYQANKGLA